MFRNLLSKSVMSFFQPQTMQLTTQATKPQRQFHSSFDLSTQAPIAETLYRGLLGSTMPIAHFLLGRFSTDTRPFRDIVESHVDGLSNHISCTIDEEVAKRKAKDGGYGSNESESSDHYQTDLRGMVLKYCGKNIPNELVEKPLDYLQSGPRVLDEKEVTLPLVLPCFLKKVEIKNGIFNNPFYLPSEKIKHTERLTRALCELVKQFKAETLTHEHLEAYIQFQYDIYEEAWGEKNPFKLTVREMQQVFPLVDFRLIPKDKTMFDVLKVDGLAYLTSRFEMDNPRIGFEK